MPLISSTPGTSSHLAKDDLLILLIFEQEIVRSVQRCGSVVPRELPYGLNVEVLRARRVPEAKVAEFDDQVATDLQTAGQLDHGRVECLERDPVFARRRAGVAQITVTKHRHAEHRVELRSALVVNSPGPDESDALVTPTCEAPTTFGDNPGS